MLPPAQKPALAQLTPPALKLPSLGIPASLVFPALGVDEPVLPALSVLGPGPGPGASSSGLHSHPDVPAGSTAEARSYADVAAYEASLGGRNVRMDSQGGFGGPNALLGSRVPVPVAVGDSLFLELDPSTVEDISDQLVDFSATAAIFRFKGFWPSLLDLHAWIGRVWEPFISGTAQIFPVARGFFIVKFDSSEDRNAILRRGFSWDEKFPLMAKPWFKDFDPSTESFNKVPLWVRLPNLPLHLWVDSVLEAVGDAIGDFLLVDSASTNVFRTTFARILVEVDTSKGLPAKICLASPIGSWIQKIDYEGIPFRCRKCHMTGHLAARCSSEKSRPKKSPSWWKNATDEHYTVYKDPTVGDGDSPLASQVAASPAALGPSPVPHLVVVASSADVSPAVAAELVIPSPSPALALDVSPGPVGGQVLVPAPAPILDLPTGFVGGRLDLVSSGEFGDFSDSPRHSASSRDWTAEAAKVEDGWTAVKRKNSRPSAPPLEMNLRSCKRGSNSKGKM